MDRNWKKAKRCWSISSYQRAGGEIPPALCMVKMPCFFLSACSFVCLFFIWGVVPKIEDAEAHVHEKWSNQQQK